MIDVGELFKQRAKELSVKYGINETHAGCFLSNYGDKYICKEHNGGCAYQSRCDKIHKNRKGNK